MATALPPSSTDKAIVDTQYRKPKPDLYTLLLVISLVAILVGIIFLCLYNSVFEWKLSDPSVQTSMMSHGREFATSIVRLIG
jgi:hypothetical protein